MRAGFFEEVGKARFVTDAVEPQIMKADEVKIKVHFTGICGSEMSAYRGRHRFRIPPVVSGHEYAGEIVEVGSAASGWSVGDRVTSDANQGCGKCYYCQRNQYNICSENRNLGARGWSGPFGEYIVVPAASLVRLPENLPYRMGALIEPLSIAMHAVRRAGLHPEENVLVIGCGPIGMGVCLAAQIAGIKNIIVADLVDFNLNLAKQMGASEMINSAIEPLEERVLTLLNGLGADAVFVAFGRSAIANQALECARSGGRVVQIGAIPDGEPFSYDVLLKKELTYLASERSVKDDYMAVVDAIDRGVIDPGPMITHIYPIEDFQKVIENVDRNWEPHMKVMFRFQQGA